MKKPLIIAGFSGIGKTHLASVYKNVIDLDPAEYVYSDEGLSHLSMEARKGMERSPNPNWPGNYIKAIKEAIKKYDIILLWDRPDIIKEYIKHNLDFVLCYPGRESLKNYQDRFLKRGNTDAYVQKKINEYNDRVEYFNKINIPKIILKDNQYLEDYLLDQEYKFEPK